MQQKLFLWWSQNFRLYFYTISRLKFIGNLNKYVLSCQCTQLNRRRQKAFLNKTFALLPCLLTTVLLKVSCDISILYILLCGWERLRYDFNVRCYKSSEMFISGQLTCNTMTFLRDIDIYHITDGKSSF